VNLSNAITLLRIALLIPMGYCLAHNYNLLSAVILIIAALSDGLDGYLARKLNQITDFGKLMDPIADKIFVAVALVLLVADPIRQLNPWVASLILSREFFVSGLRSLFAAKGIILSAEKSAKWKTTFQFMGIGGYLIYDKIIPFLPTFLLLGQICMAAAIILSFWSMISYIKKLKDI
jgi:CDP-diacylglycerol--glycerol-3-phosphate 3-phosphatidyltransferase